MKTILSFTALIMAILVSSCGSTKQRASESGKEGIGENRADVAHNSKNSLDWQGTYAGVLPCADCEGILTVITISNDRHYLMQTRYNGKSRQVFDTKGTLTWDSRGGIITLGETKYKVGENKLIQLDRSGNLITGEIADKYVLSKSAPGLDNKPWRMFEAANRTMATDSINPPVWFRLDTTEKRVYGNTGCNSYNGDYELEDGNRIKFSNIISTLMACPEMQNEAFLMRALYAADNYFISNDTLILNKAKMAPLARFKVDYFAE